MDVEKQHILVSSMASSREVLSQCISLLKPSYFDPSLKKTVKFIVDYFNEHKDVPRVEVIKAETGIKLDIIPEVTRAERHYVCTEMETFCRNKAVEEAILEGPELLRKQDFSQIIDKLKTAISVGLQKDLGIDYFEDPATRLRDTLIDRETISTGWNSIDAVLGGGLSRQELILFTANSGGGKSMNMLNLAKNLLLQGFNGIYISLEMGEGVVSKRLDSMITNIGQDQLLKDMDKVASLIEKSKSKMGNFRIKRMPENRTTIHHVRAYLQQLEQDSGFRPDFIVIDYVDIMGTASGVSADNMFIKDKFVTEEIRSLGFDFDCVMISASQLGRSAIEAEKLNQAHIQGGISKINTADYVIGIKQSDEMRSAGEINFEILKSRNSGGVGQRVLLKWDPISLNVSDAQSSKNDAGLTINKKQNKVLATAAKSQADPLVNLFEINTSGES